MRELFNDTIAGIATPPGVGGISIIRISGKDAFSLCSKIFASSKGKLHDVNSFDSHTVHYGYILDKQDLIDEVLLTVMKAPKSYTAEDVAEIGCHGGITVTKRVLETVVNAGARLAEPGEFTKRAFMNGRIDMTEAESVMDIISSKNDFARKNALSTMRGAIFQKVSDLRERIIHETAFIEAALDDPEHYELSDYGNVLKPIVLNLISEISKLSSSYNDGRMMSEGINTVIVGKSSLLNLLAGEERAIVTSVAGTTRDTLDISVNLGGILLNIIDTAGIHETDDLVEKIGVDKAIDSIEKADLVLCVLDSSLELSDEDLEILERTSDKERIVILNKSDLPQMLNLSGFQKKFNCMTISMSANVQSDINKIKNAIETIFYNGKITRDSEIYITNLRQLSELENALSSLKLVLNAIEDGMTEDVYTIDLMDAYNYLGNVIGQSTDDDLADKIFKDFCMGK